MDNTQLASRLAELCRKGKFEQAQKEFYSNDAVSIEQESMQGFPRETKGLDAIIEKGHKYQQMVSDLHEIAVSEPLVAGDSIAFKLTMDTTMKGKPRSKDSELCVYKVKNGKIIQEEFFN
ncbi:MAG: hypothetical protein C5B52_04260 [Bacteroidetes bacterium]|nr:MAG: hypothetical protein C5B52_04260 [Bacteroidota bacterium]